MVGALITIAVAVLMFSAVLVSIQYSIRLQADASSRLAAMSLATERMEYFRSLSYDDVGVVSGFPAGVIPPNRTITLNGIDFSERVLVDYVDDPADDVLGVDSNGIITDYKKLKMEISWTAHGVTQNVSYVSNIVPVSVETDEGGGAINVEVNDADGSSLEGASVQVTNDTLSPTIDITRNTGPTGLASFIVPAGSNYHASATMSGYSVDKTYESTPTNLNPSPGSFTVVESLITDQGFQIGELSDMEISTLSAVDEASSTEAFVGFSGIQASSSVVLQAGKLELEESGGVYEAAGTVTLQQIDPASLERWESAVIVGTIPANTDYRVQFYTGTTTGYVLVDEGDLPGNATGFHGKIVDLTNLDVATYPDLTVEISLTGDTTDTPEVDDIAVYYRTNTTDRASTNLTIRSKKTIGTSPDVYKYEDNHTTDGSGLLTLVDMEFDDEYTVVNTDGLTLARACADVELDYSQTDVLFDHQAGVDTTLELVFENIAADTLLTIVTTDADEPLPGAVVTLDRTGFSATSTTDSCGQAFFSATDGAQTDYTVGVSRVGYSDYTNATFEINGDTRLKVVMNEV